MCLLKIKYDDSDTMETILCREIQCNEGYSISNANISLIL